MENFFKESTLTALRELALRQAAHELEVREIASTSEERQPQQELSSTSPSSPIANTDRILIYVSADASTAMLIRRGRRMADYLGADCFAVSVAPLRDKACLPTQDRNAVEKHLNFARNLHIETRILEGDDAAETIVDLRAAIKLRRYSSAAATIAHGVACSELISFCGSFGRQKIFA